MSGVDWEARLKAQDVPQEKIADAKNAARAMASVLEGVAFSPVDPLGPDAFAKILAGKDAQ